MKTAAEIKFEKIIKEGFYEVLKPLGFKKKNSSFYLPLDDIGQIINVQKSRYGTKEQIRFTINTGIFMPEFWRGYNSNTNKAFPKFPNELDCFVRNRIGSIRNQEDLWYNIEERTDENGLIFEIKENLELYILPYFKKLNSRENLLSRATEKMLLKAPRVGKLIIYGELKELDKAKAEYKRLLENYHQPLFLENLKNYAKKYNLE